MRVLIYVNVHAHVFQMKTLVKHAVNHLVLVIVNGGGRGAILKAKCQKHQKIKPEISRPDDEIQQIMVMNEHGGKMNHYVSEKDRETEVLVINYLLPKRMPNSKREYSLR